MGDRGGAADGTCPGSPRLLQVLQKTPLGTRVGAVDAAARILDASWVNSIVELRRNLTAHVSGLTTQEDEAWVPFIDALVEQKIVPPPARATLEQAFRALLLPCVQNDAARPDATTDALPGAVPGAVPLKNAFEQMSHHIAPPWPVSSRLHMLANKNGQLQFYNAEYARVYQYRTDLTSKAAWQKEVDRRWKLEKEVGDSLKLLTKRDGHDERCRIFFRGGKAGDRCTPPEERGMECVPLAREREMALLSVRASQPTPKCLTPNPTVCAPPIGIGRRIMS